MLGRSHLLCNVAVAGTFASCATVIIYTAEKDEIAGVLAPAISRISDWLLADEPVYSLLTLLSLALFLLGSLLPDIDSRSSALGRFVYLPVEHRTWTHAIYIPVLFCLIGIFWRPMFWLGMGYFLHLWFDSISTCGICWLYPYPGYIGFDSGARIKRGHWLKLYRTKSASEKVIIVFVYILFAASLYWGITSGAFG